MKNCGLVGLLVVLACGTVDFTYGYAEARVQFSRQPGWWSAFWLYGVEQGVNPFLRGQEIDIYEDFFKPKRRNVVRGWQGDGTA